VEERVCITSAPYLSCTQAPCAQLDRQPNAAVSCHGSMGSTHETACATHSARAAGGATHLQGRGEVVHDFQAALAEELSVAAGESVRPGPTLTLAWQAQTGALVVRRAWPPPQGALAAVRAYAQPGIPHALAVYVRRPCTRQILRMPRSTLHLEVLLCSDAPTCNM